jgi:hypothetical protein
MDIKVVIFYNFQRWKILKKNAKYYLWKNG